MLGLFGTSSYAVFAYLFMCICVFVYETLIIFDIFGPRAFRKYMHHIVEISGDVTTAGRMDTRTTTRKDSATQLLISEKLSLATEEAVN